MNSDGKAVEPCSFEKAPTLEFLNEEDVSFLEGQRKHLFAVRMAVLRRLLGSLRERNAAGLFENCLEPLIEGVEAPDLDSYIRLDNLYAGLDASGAAPIADRESRPVLLSGGITHLFEVVGHCEKELRVGTMAETHKSLGELAPGVVSDRSWEPMYFLDYYGAVSRGKESFIECALERYSELEPLEIDCWKSFRGQLSEAMDSQFEVTIRTEIRVKKKYAKDFAPFAMNRLEGWRIQQEMTGGLPPPEDLERGNGDEVTENLFRKDGENWSVAFAGKATQLRHRKGYTYIGYLLKNPNQSFPAEDLLSEAGELPTYRVREGLEGNYEDVGSGSIRGARSPGQVDEILDTEAIAALKVELMTIAGKMEEEEKFGNLEECVKLDKDREMIEAQLLSGEGLGGRRRTFTSSESKAAKKVAASIRRSIKTIGKYHHPLGDHLDSAISAGYRFEYRPTDKIRWLA